jgi:hypothetical protein
MKIKGNYLYGIAGAAIGATAVLVYMHTKGNTALAFSAKKGKGKGGGQGKKGHNASKSSKGMRGQHMSMMKGMGGKMMKGGMMKGGGGMMKGGGMGGGGGGGMMMDMGGGMAMDMGGGDGMMMDQSMMDMPMMMHQHQMMNQVQNQPVAQQMSPMGPCILDMATNQFLIQGTMIPCTPSQGIGMSMDPNALNQGVPLTTNPSGIATAMSFYGTNGKSYSVVEQDDQDLYDMYGNASRGHTTANSWIAKQVSPYDDDSRTTPYPKPIEWYNYVARPANLH